MCMLHGIIRRHSKRNVTFGTILYIGNSRQSISRKLPTKLCNVCSGYIYHTLINWDLKMLISSIWGKEVGKDRGGGGTTTGRKNKKLWKESDFHKLIFSFWLLRFNTGKSSPGSTTVLNCHPPLTRDRHPALKRCQPAGTPHMTVAL